MAGASTTNSPKIGGLRTFRPERMIGPYSFRNTRISDWTNVQEYNHGHENQENQDMVITIR